MVKEPFKLAIFLYKRLISPVLPPSCRFYPSCADYAYEAIEVHGVIKGLLYATRRLTRCHPLNPGGYEPVPSGKSIKVNY